MNVIEIVKIFAESLGASLVGVCGVGILFLIIIAFGCSLFGGDENDKSPDDESDDGDYFLH